MKPFAVIYKITNLTNGKFYIGKKQLLVKRKKKISKKEKKLSGTRKRVEIVQVDGKWDSYWGSSQELLQDIKKLGVHNFKKEILQEVNSKSAASYWEAWWQFNLHVLMGDTYNKWIAVKVYKNRLI